MERPPTQSPSIASLDSCKGISVLSCWVVICAIHSMAMSSGSLRKWRCPGNLGHSPSLLFPYILHIPGSQAKFYQRSGGPANKVRVGAQTLWLGAALLSSFFQSPFFRPYCQLGTSTRLLHHPFRNRNFGSQVFSVYHIDRPEVAALFLPSTLLLPPTRPSTNS